MPKYSAHLTRVLVESISSYSPYKGTRLSYKRDYDVNPVVNVDITTKMDIERAITTLYRRGDLTTEELLMLQYVILDGNLSRRDISKMIEEDQGLFINQRTISRRLDSAYWKISKFLGFDYSDKRLFKMVAKQMGRPAPYILNDDEVDKIQQIMEKV